MRRWQIRMTFEGYAHGEVTHDAIQAFKRALGVAPEAMRSEVHMTDLRVVAVDEECQGVGPDVEQHVWAAEPRE
jgi:hypothetical protein